jgi:hypothetical protein
MPRKKTHCHRGHELTPENVRLQADGGRRCKICDNEARKLRYASDPTFRRRALAYSHWWKVGDPQGRPWSKIKEELGL